MFIYESHRSTDKNYIYTQKDINLNFALHMHNSYEFIYCENGIIEVTVEEEKYILKANDCMLIPSIFAHSYTTDNFSETFICIFSQHHVPDYYESHKKLKAKNPVFIVTNIEKNILMLNSNNIYQIKSALYNIVATEYQHVEFERYDISKRTLIHTLVDYISTNCCNDLTLHSISSTLGYSYNYISAVFNQAFNANFSHILNSYRINYAQAYLTSTNLTITEVASKCGYDSVRTFNRNFIKFTGKTPSEYKQYF